MKKIAARWFKITAGLIITLIGVILMPVPGPGGTPVTLFGLAILSTELPWAKSLRERFMRLLSTGILKRNIWLRAGVIAGVIGIYTLSSFVAYRIFTNL